MEQSEMQTKDESSIEENYVRLLHCPQRYSRDVAQSKVRKSSPVIASQYETQQLYPCIQTGALLTVGLSYQMVEPNSRP